MADMKKRILLFALSVVFVINHSFRMQDNEPQTSWNDTM
jgi:hypothetical protein